MGSIGDRVWFDGNMNQIQDSEEVGLIGIRVDLLDETMMNIGSTSTGIDGIYTFTDLPEGSYTVVITPRSDLLATFDLDGTLDSQTTVTLGAGEDRTDVDFGFQRKKLFLHWFWIFVLTHDCRTAFCWRPDLA